MFANRSLASQISTEFRLVFVSGGGSVPYCTGKLEKMDALCYEVPVIGLTVKNVPILDKSQAYQVLTTSIGKRNKPGETHIR